MNNDTTKAQIALLKSSVCTRAKVDGDFGNYKATRDLV